LVRAIDEVRLSLSMNPPNTDPPSKLAGASAARSSSGGGSSIMKLA
jgi:hypothetical protein